MTPEELAEKFWDSLERQRVELSLPVLAMRDPAQPFGSVHDITNKMWIQAAQDVLDAQKAHKECNKATCGHGKVAATHCAFTWCSNSRDRCEDHSRGFDDWGKPGEVKAG